MSAPPPSSPSSPPPATPSASAGSSAGAASVPVAADGSALVLEDVDAVGAGMAASAGQFIAGLLAYGQLASVGTPRALAAGLLPDMDPDVRQAVVDRLLAIGFHAGRLSVRPELHGEELASVREKLRRAGFEAMSGQVSRSLNTVCRTGAVRGWGVDGESARGH